MLLTVCWFTCVHYTDYVYIKAFVLCVTLVVLCLILALTVACGITLLTLVCLCSMPAYTNPREAEAVRRVKLELQGLQIHASVKRQKTSATIKDLVSYVNSQMEHDLLIYPEKANPFKPKKSCTIL